MISGPINTVAEVVSDPQLRARGMIADHWDERIGRNVKGPGVVPVLSETPGTIRNAGSARPGQHNDEVYGELLGRSAPRSSTRCARRGCCDRAPTHVDIREVCLRDGLQIEEPIPLSAKLELLEAVVGHRGARDRGDGVRLAVEGARTRRRRRTRRRTAPLRPTASSSRRWWPAPAAPSAQSRRA